MVEDNDTEYDKKSVDYLPAGTTLPYDVLPVVDDAGRAIARMADGQDRKIKAERLDQIRRGAFDTIIVRDLQGPVCFLAVEPMGEDVTLRFGHMLPEFERDSEAILAIVVNALVGRGFRSIASVFKWPQLEAFVRAAEAIGFTRVDRMEMVRKPDAGGAQRALPAGIRVVPWSPRYLKDAARILFENAYSGDLVFHRPYRTPEGCRTYLNAILDDRYGRFLPECSFVACDDDRPVGQLLAARIPYIGVNIGDLAVDRAFRGRGIASSLFGSLIEANAAQKENIVLAVTGSNTTAIRLYERMGFQATACVRQYIYDIDL